MNSMKEFEGSENESERNENELERNKFRSTRRFLQPTGSTLQQALRFTLVGFAALALDMAVTVAGKEWAGWNYMVSAGLGYLVGLSANYLLSITWVFDQRRLSAWQLEFGLFAVIGVAGLGLTELICYVGTDGVGMDYRWSKFVAAVVVAVWNFLVRKAVLFSRPGRRIWPPSERALSFAIRGWLARLESRSASR
jgi:putative flippase GtrA